jgi:hypothetical protein
MTERPRSKMPPTEKQLQRLGELIEHEAIAPHLDSVMKKFDTQIRTRGGAGLLLGWMKGEIQKWEQAHTR